MRGAPHPFLTYLVNAMVILLSQQLRMLLIGFLATRNSHLTEKPVFRPSEVNTFINIDGLPDTYLTCCFCLQVRPIEPCFRGAASLEIVLLSVGTGLNGIQFRRRIATRRSKPSSPWSSQMPGSNGCITLTRVWRRRPLGLGPSRGEDAACYLLSQIPTFISCLG
jgi:hypothetical protein